MEQNQLKLKLIRHQTQVVEVMILQMQDTGMMCLA